MCGMHQIYCRWLAQFQYLDNKTRPTLWSVESNPFKMVLQWLPITVRCLNANKHRYAHTHRHGHTDTDTHTHTHTNAHTHTHTSHTHFTYNDTFPYEPGPDSSVNLTSMEDRMLLAFCLGGQVSNTAVKTVARGAEEPLPMACPVRA